MPSGGKHDFLTDVLVKFGSAIFMPCGIRTQLPFKMAGINFHVFLTVFFIALTMFDQHCKATTPNGPSPNNAPSPDPSSNAENVSSSIEPPQPTETPTRTANKQGCSEYLTLLPKNNRSCMDGNGNTNSICYPLALSDGVVDVGRKLNIKPSRRFRISAPDPETSEPAGTCPTNADSRNFGSEFETGPITFLDDYHQLFMDLVEDLGWPECRMKITTTGATEQMTVTTTTTPTTTPRSTTTMAIITNVKQFKEVVFAKSKSYELLITLESGCVINVFGRLPKNRNFTVQLLHDAPKPVEGVGETMFKINVTDTEIKMKTRFHQWKILSREKWLKERKDGKSIGVNLKIWVFDDKYDVLLDDKLVASLPSTDPLWAINYTYISGFLKLREKDPIIVQCPNRDETKMLPPHGSIDWSNKMDNMVPTELMVQDLHVKSQGALSVFLLKGCSKFDMNMTVCTLAIEYKLSCGANGSQFIINMYNREVENGTALEIGKATDVAIDGAKNYTVTIGLDHIQGVGLLVHGHAWQKAEVLHKLQKWEQYTHDYADFVQVLTEGDLAVGHWQLDTAPRPMYSALSIKPKDAKLVKIPLGNWKNGDYIRLHTKHLEFEEKGEMLLNFYRGYPDWIDEEDPEKETHHKQTGQLMLQLQLNKGRIEFKHTPCIWTELRQKVCDLRNYHYHWFMARGINESVLDQDGREFVIHIVVQKQFYRINYKNATKWMLSNGTKLVVSNGTNYENVANVNLVSKRYDENGTKWLLTNGRVDLSTTINYKNGIKVELFEPNKTALLATYVLAQRTPHYFMEYFSVNPNNAGELMEIPQLCKQNFKTKEWNCK